MTINLSRTRRRYQVLEGRVHAYSTLLLPIIRSCPLCATAGRRRTFMAAELRTPRHGYNKGCLAPPTPTWDQTPSPIHRYFTTWYIIYGVLYFVALPVALPLQRGNHQQSKHASHSAMVVPASGYRDTCRHVLFRRRVRFVNAKKQGRRPVVPSQRQRPGSAVVFTRYCCTRALSTLSLFACYRGGRLAVARWQAVRNLNLRQQSLVSCPWQQWQMSQCPHHKRHRILYDTRERTR